MKRILIALVVVLVVLGVAGSLAFRSGQARAKTAGGDGVVKVQRGDVVVSVVETGTVDAVKSVEVRSRASGRLARLLVEEGDVVTQGQLIAIVDPQETQLRVEQDSAQLRGAQSAVQRTAIEIEQRRQTARADVDQARARVAQLRDELRAQPVMTRTAIESSETALSSALQAKEQLTSVTQPGDRIATQTELQEAELGHRTASNELRRRQELVEKGYIAKRSVDEAQLQEEAARARVTRARDRASRLEQQQRLEVRQADERIKQARADLERARAGTVHDSVKAKELESAIAGLRRAEASLRDVEAMQKSREQGQATVAQLSSVLGESRRQLRETEIRAPISGVVTKKLVQEGELVASLSSFSAGTPIVRIEDRREMMVKLEVNEIDVAKMQLEMPVSVEVDALPKERFQGIVHRIAPASKVSEQGQMSTDTVVRYEVEVRLLNASQTLRSGMTARCRLEVLRQNDVLVLPAEYVGRDGEKRFVEVPKEGEKQPERVYVQVGAESGSRVEILSGIDEGAQVNRPAYKGPPRKGAMSFGPDEDDEE
jgi:HlyD family secretion protein